MTRSAQIRPSSPLGRPLRRPLRILFPVLLGGVLGLGPAGDPGAGGRRVVVALIPGVAPAMAQAPEVVTPQDGVVSLEAGEGKLVRVPRDVSTVFVAEPEIADVQVTSPRLIYLVGKAPGKTTLFSVDDREKVTAGMTVVVTPGLSRLRAAVRRMHPDSDVRISALDGRVVLEGTAATPVDAENLTDLAAQAVGDPDLVVSRLTVPGSNQVNIRVRIAEVSREVTKSLGVNWFNSLNAYDSSGTSGLDWALQTVNPFSAGSAVFSTLMGGIGANASVGATLEALEDEGLISILAEPNLTTVSGESANFLAGGEFPILYPDDNGTIVIEYKQFGVSLAFTPTIVGPNRINLKIKPEVSQIDDANSVTLGGFQIPALTTRRVETTVELASGQTFAVAGLLQNNFSQTINQVPGLGELPVLGRLFSSDSFQRNETELVILITPFLVRPVSSQASATPVDGLIPPSDAERAFNSYTLGRLNPTEDPTTTGSRAPVHNGPLGFQF